MIEFVITINYMGCTAGCVNKIESILGQELHITPNVISNTTRQQNIQVQQSNITEFLLSSLNLNLC